MTGVQTCALPICESKTRPNSATESPSSQDQAEQENNNACQFQNQQTIFHSYKPIQTDIKPIKDLHGTRMVLSARRSNRKDKVYGDEAHRGPQDKCQNGTIYDQGVKVSFDLNEKVKTEEKEDASNIEATAEKSSERVPRLAPEQTVYYAGGTGTICKQYETNANSSELRYAWMAVDSTKTNGSKPRSDRTTTIHPTAKQTLGGTGVHSYHSPHAPSKTHTKTQTNAETAKGISNDKTVEQQNVDNLEEHVSLDRLVIV